MGRKKAKSRRKTSKRGSQGPVGLRNRKGIWHIDKRVRGVTIRESTGTGDVREAELILAKRIDEVRQQLMFGARPVITFRQAADRFLSENTHLSNHHNYTHFLKRLDPFVGHLPLTKIHIGTLQPFIDLRKKEGVKNKTINGHLSVVRRILNLASRLWRDENGFTWLETPALIQMLPTLDSKSPTPLTWEEQDQLFEALPLHLRNMCLFKVNTGTREQEVVQLRWDWYIDVPELNTAVFLIPREMVKNREERLVVLNDVAQSVIDDVRNDHPERVFTYKGKPVTKIYNSAYKRAREAVGLEDVRVHDFKHTFGRRLRAAGVPLETRKVLLGHRNGDITSHYSAPELEELLEAANLACRRKFGKTSALIVLRRKSR